MNLLITLTNEKERVKVIMIGPELSAQTMKLSLTKQYMLDKRAGNKKEQIWNYHIEDRNTG